MKKQNRLRKNHQFQKIINSKNQMVSKYIVLYYKFNNLNCARFGISVSKKFTNAVGRNKIRRQVRSILDEINIFNKPIDVVIIIRMPFMNASYEDKLSSLKKLFKRI